jgi:hypothetical protein
MWRYRLPTYTVSRLDCAKLFFCCWPLLAVLLLLLLPTACRPVFFLLPSGTGEID